MTHIKSFRGQLADGTQDTIVLHTNTGAIGYRVVKFQLMVKTPGQANSEHCVKIFKIAQTTASIDGAINFSDNTLLAAGIVSNSSSGYSQIYNAPPVIFDNEIFNQDIYITHFESHSNEDVNYYIELEQIKLDLNQNTVATLKDIRNTVGTS